MSGRFERDIRNWMEAERGGADELAEQALRRVFEQLGRRAPEAGFADRVLLRAGRLAPASAVWRWRWLRGAVAACLLGAGLAVAVLPFLLPAAAPLLHACTSPLVASVSHSAARWLSAGFAMWAVVADVASAFRAALATPTAVLVLTANVLIALASLFGLRQLLKAPEELLPW